MNKLRLKRTYFDRPGSGAPYIVSVISGKGGVGKSIVAFNTAERIASFGRTVLLIDADENFGNQHIFANVKSEYGFEEFYNEKLSLGEAVTKTGYGFDLLSSVNVRPDFESYDAAGVAGFMNRLRTEGVSYDFIIIDHSSGLSKLAAICAYASDTNLIVMIPELTSISDSYGLFKYLMDADAVIDCQLVINRTESKEEAEYIYTKFCAISERFLNKTPKIIRNIAEDEAVKKSIAAQTSLAALDKRSQAAKDIMKLSAKLLKDKSLKEISGGNINPEIINKMALTADIKE